MAGTKAGGKAAAATNKAKHGKDFYAKIGAAGGKAKNPNKGFGYDDRTAIQKFFKRPKRAALAGAKGGKISKRGAK